VVGCKAVGFDTKLTLNNTDVNLRQTKNRQVLPTYVFVLSLEGQILMPTKASRARKFIKSGKAKVIKVYPFTIQMTVECENNTQPISLGIDSGYGFIGFSATTKTKELLCGTLKLDGKTKERLDEKKMYRRLRRSRHHWYRKSRFNNRKRSDGWLPPSIERRYQTHLNLINKIKCLLPITEIVIETAKFDIQKIDRPDIEGVEYQRGDMYDYQNIKLYLMVREKGCCQFCSKDFKGQSAHIHHIKPKSKGGTDKTSNLALLHEKCHNTLHEKHLESKLKSNTKNYKPNTFMSVINKKFWNDIPNLKITYGYITFINRNKLNIEKSHYNDAFIISGGNIQKRSKPIIIKQKHRNNRAIQLNRKGFRPSVRKERYKIQPKDLVWVGKTKYISKGMKNKGVYITFETEEKKNYIKTKDITKIYNYGSFVWN
jgi:5-methylcytosine-specific restriction endonuclease McrA